MHNLNSVLKEDSTPCRLLAWPGPFPATVRSEDLHPHARSMISEMTTRWIDYHKRLMERATDGLVKDPATAMFCFIIHRLADGYESASFTDVRRSCSTLAERYTWQILKFRWEEFDSLRRYIVVSIWHRTSIIRFYKRCFL